jgi:hypothetical protein
LSHTFSEIQLVSFTTVRSCNNRRDASHPGIVNFSDDLSDPINGECIQRGVVILYMVRAIAEYTPSISNPIQSSLSNVSEWNANFCGKQRQIGEWHTGIQGQRDIS